MILSDTIAAIATPRGEGGIGIVRVSGALAVPIACKIFRSPRGISPDEFSTHTLNYGHVVHPTSNAVVDEVMLGVMLAPKSYTAEDIVEFNCHGGVIPLQRVLELTLHAGARLAEPGEFTKRAFLNDRLDLVQAEAVVDVIRSKTELNFRVAIDQLSGRLSQGINALSDRLANLLAEVEASIDFPDEDLDFIDAASMRKSVEAILEGLNRLMATASDGKILREGIHVAILGKPNVGKSSLLNALLQEERAIVADIPGTTRDTIEESLNLRGIPLKLIDTAGIHQTADFVERQGVARSKSYIDAADLLLVMFDASQPLTGADAQLLEAVNCRNAIFVLNKVDLPIVTTSADLQSLAPMGSIVQTSVLHGDGIEALKTAIIKKILKGRETVREGLIVTNLRHYEALRRARVALEQARDGLSQALPPDLIAVDFRTSLDCLGEIVGVTTTEDILDRIFSQFCIGK